MISNVRGVRAVKSAATRIPACLAAGEDWLGLPVLFSAESPFMVGGSAVVSATKVSGWEIGVNLEIWASRTSESSPEPLFWRDFGSV